MTVTGSDRGRSGGMSRNAERGRKRWKGDAETHKPDGAARISGELVRNELLLGLILRYGGPPSRHALVETRTKRGTERHILVPERRLSLRLDKPNYFMEDKHRLVKHHGIVTSLTRIFHSDALCEATISTSDLHDGVESGTIIPKLPALMQPQPRKSQTGWCLHDSQRRLMAYSFLLIAHHDHALFSGCSRTNGRHAQSRQSRM